MCFIRPRPLRTPALLLALLCCASAAAQDPRPGYVLVDDMYLPEEVVYGDSTFSANPWPGGVVPYVLDANVTPAREQALLAAMAEWEACADVDFVPRGNQPHYIHVQSSTTNSSHVGMIGGAQALNIFNWGWRFIIAHELGHALGLVHEHQRPDRNAFVQILCQNMTGGCSGSNIQVNFSLINSATTIGDYDFDSVMHYPQDAFSANGQATIIVLPPHQVYQTSMGQRLHLSIPDALGMATRYGAPAPPHVSTVTPGTVNGGSSVALTVHGSRFLPGSLDGIGLQGSVVRWNGIAVPTTFVDPETLSAQVPAHVVTGTSGAITVENPHPGGGTSSTATLAVFVAPIDTAVNPANGRTYHLLSSSGWMVAEQTAIQLGGHLVALNDAAEEQWVTARFAGPALGRTLWVGLSDVASEGTFVWSNGEPLNYVNWCPGEPNNLGNEDFVHLNCNLSGWNDLRGDPPSPVHGVVEVCPPNPLLTTIVNSVVNPINGHTYHLLEPSSWSAAQQAAVAMGGHLVTLNDQGEESWMRLTFGAPPHGPRRVWIGLNDAVSEGAFVWASGEPVTYLNWCPGEPNNLGNEDYVQVTCTGSWNDHVDDPASGAVHGVVEVSGELPSIVETAVNPANGHFYHLLTVSDWTTAEARAIQLGGHLVTINSQAEQDWVVERFVACQFPRQVWIGLHDSSHEGVFQWISGEPVAYENWIPGEPNNVGIGGEDHVHLHSSWGGRWNDNVNLASRSGAVFVGLVEVCTGGTSTAYGLGCPGLGGVIPSLTIDRCPAAGQTMALTIGDALGGAQAYLVIGQDRASIPYQGCLLNVTPVLGVVLVTLTGAGPGAGSGFLTFSLPPSLSTFRATVQGAVLDPGGSLGLATTNGLEILLP